MFIFDFDDTLFDTYNFKRARLSAVKKLGVPEMLFLKTYQVARNNVDGIITYTDEAHAQILSQQGYNYEEILRALKNTTNKNLKKFIFPEAVGFISFLKKYNRPLILLSLGQDSFQELKVKGTKLDNYFDRTFFTDTNKINVLKELALSKKKNIWFFNDKIAETTEISKEFPNIKCVLKQSENFNEEDYQKSGFKYFKTWQEIQNYVAGNIK